MHPPVNIDPAQLFAPEHQVMFGICTSRLGTGDRPGRGFVLGWRKRVWGRKAAVLQVSFPFFFRDSPLGWPQTQFVAKDR